MAKDGTKHYQSRFAAFAELHAHENLGHKGHIAIVLQHPQIAADDRDVAYITLTTNDAAAFARELLECALYVESRH
jgi:hypothetical protein